MTNFRKTVVTFVLRLYLFLKDSIATLARILRSTQPSAPRTYSVGSDGSIRTLRPLTDTVHHSHERGSTFDISQTKPLGTELPILGGKTFILPRNRANTCYRRERMLHVFVGDGGEYLDVLISSPVGNLEQAPTLIDDVADSGVAPSRIRYDRARLGKH